MGLNRLKTEKFQNLLKNFRVLAPAQRAAGGCSPLKATPGRGPAARRKFFRILVASVEKLMIFWWHMSISSCFFSLILGLFLLLHFIKGGYTLKWGKMVENDKSVFYRYHTVTKFSPAQRAVGDCSPLKESPGRGPPQGENFSELLVKINDIFMGIRWYLPVYFWSNLNYPIIKWGIYIRFSGINT